MGNNLALNLAKTINGSGDDLADKVRTGMEISSVMEGRIDPKIQTVLMSPDQQRIFEMFRGLGSERSIPKLHAHLQSQAIIVAESTLKKWSTKFKWFDLAERTDQEIAKGIADAAIPSHADRMTKDLKAMAKLKDGFYEKVENGEVQITTLAEFVTVLKAEALILGDPTERTEHTTVTRLEADLKLTPAQVEMVLKLKAAEEYGLPVPGDIIDGDLVYYEDKDNEPQ